MVGVVRGKGDCSATPEGYLLPSHGNRVFEYMARFHGHSVEYSIRTGHQEEFRDYDKVFYF